MNTINKSLVAAVIGGAFLAGFAGGIVGNATFGAAGANERTDLAEENKTITQVVNEESQMIAAIEKVKPAVVSIVATKDLQIIRGGSPFGGIFGFPFGGTAEQPQVETQRQQVSGGTGFVVSEDGLILTNKHVVQDTEADYSVVMADGKEYRANVVSRDPANDLAVVQIYEGETGENKPNSLPTVEFGESGALKVGQRVIAIGNALGEFQNTVTSGIISAVSRQIEASDQLGNNRDVLTNLLQTDAPINSGNSGGPLINLSGQVVAVNTAIASNGNSIGFAIPIDDVTPVIASVKEFGHIVRPQLGVRYVILNPARAKELGISVEQGALIVGDRVNGLLPVLPGSAAEKAGLKIDDVITAIGEQDITEDFGLKDAIRNKKPGDEVVLKVWRDGKAIEIKLKLDEFKEETVNEQKPITNSR